MLVVGKAVNYAAKGGVANTALIPTDLDLGAVGIYGRQDGAYRDTLIISGATATGKTAASDFKGKTIKICEGLGGGKFKTSEFMDVKGISQVNPSAYSAPVAWKAYIGYNGTTGGVVLGEFGTVRNELLVKVKERYENLEEGMPYYYDVLLNATGETQQTILTKIKAAIDDGRGNPVIFTTAISNSGAEYGLSLTAKDLRKQYVISMEGPIEDTPITINGADYGSGTYLGLIKFEKESQAKKGNLYTSDAEFTKKVPASLVDGTTYDTYVLGAVNSLIPGGYGGAGLAGNANVETSVGVQVVFPSTEDNDAGKNQIEFETIIKALTGVTFTTLVETGV